MTVDPQPTIPRSTSRTPVTAQGAFSMRIHSRPYQVTGWCTQIWSFVDEKYLLFRTSLTSTSRSTCDRAAGRVRALTICSHLVSVRVVSSSIDEAGKPLKSCIVHRQQQAQNLKGSSAHGCDLNMVWAREPHRQ